MQFAPRPTGFQCPYASNIQSYCDAADPYCCNGNDANTHQGYATEYGSVALTFVKNKLNAALSGSGSGGGGGSGTTTAPSGGSTGSSGGSGGSAAHYGQCGGQGWTGPTTCASPYTCQCSNSCERYAFLSVGMITDCDRFRLLSVLVSGYVKGSVDNDLARLMWRSIVPATN
jgi:hypothetical protein